MCCCSYFIPEDGDVEIHPNVFLAPKPRHAGMPPTLGEVKNSFPLPGRYHFRFKTALTPGGDREKNPMAVWMDCVDDRKPIPVWKNSVIAKVTRISVEEEDDDDDDEDFVRPAAAAARPATHRPAPVPAATPQQPPRRPAAEPLLDVFDGPHTTSTSSATTASSAAPTTVRSAPTSGAAGPPGNLFDAAPPPASLLDMDSPVYSTASSTANDFLGMTAPAPATPQQPVYGQPTHGFPPQQQQHQQQRQHHQQQQAGRPNAFNQYSQQQGPFGGLGTPWKP